MSKAASEQVPNDLDLVIDYVNTRDLEAGSDELDSAASLTAWLTERGLLRGSQRAGASELARALELREALRRLMLANNGGRERAQDWEALERAAARGRLGVHFAPTGAVSEQPGVEGPDGALARLIAPVARSVADGTWQRAKACRADDCAWAFYDRSRNRSAVWCEMAVCGNRTKVRAYRDRAGVRSR